MNCLDSPGDFQAQETLHTSHARLMYRQLFVTISIHILDIVCPVKERPDLPVFRYSITEPTKISMGDKIMNGSAQITGRTSIAREFRMIAVAGIFLLIAATATVLAVTSNQTEAPVTQNAVT